MASGSVGAQGLEPNKPGSKAHTPTVRPPAGFFIPLSFRVLFNPPGVGGRVTGVSKESKFPADGKSLGSISLSPFFCSVVSLLLGQVVSQPLRGSWVSHLEQSCPCHLFHYLQLSTRGYFLLWWKQ